MTKRQKPAQTPKPDAAVAAAIAASKATPTLTYRQKLDLMQAMQAAESAAQAATPQAIANTIVQLMQDRAQASQTRINAANKLIASLNCHPGYQLDPRTGEFTQKLH